MKSLTVAVSLGLLAVGVVLTAAYFWLVVLPPLRPSGVDGSYDFVWTQIHTGVWLRCQRTSMRKDAAVCRMIRQDGHEVFETMYLTYPPSTPLPRSRLRIDSSATDAVGGIQHIAAGVLTFEPIIRLRGCFVLFPANQYYDALSEYTRELGIAADSLQ